MAIENSGHEYEFEPQFGLPERLPSDEFIVWQGSPDVRALATSAFHFNKLAFYFAALILVSAWPALESGSGFMAILMSIKWIAPLAVIGMVTVWLLASLTARTTVLTVSFNLPLKQVASADVRVLPKGFGDITLALKGSDRIGWVHLWPSVRPWRITKPEPTLRAIPDVELVAEKLREVWTQRTGQTANATTASSETQADRQNNTPLQVRPI
jgi:hypothetical protein